MSTVIVVLVNATEIVRQTATTRHTELAAVARVMRSKRTMHQQDVSSVTGRHSVGPASRPTATEMPGHAVRLVTDSTPAGQVTTTATTTTTTTTTLLIRSFKHSLLPVDSCCHTCEP